VWRLSEIENSVKKRKANRVLSKSKKK